MATYTLSIEYEFANEAMRDAFQRSTEMENFGRPSKRLFDVDFDVLRRTSKVINGKPGIRLFGVFSGNSKAIAMHCLGATKFTLKFDIDHAVRMEGSMPIFTRATVRVEQSTWLGFGSKVIGEFTVPEE